MLYQIVGIVILAAFYGYYFVKMVSQKKKGIKTDQISDANGILREICLVIQWNTVPSSLGLEGGQYIHIIYVI